MNGHAVAVTPNYGGDGEYTVSLGGIDLSGSNFFRWLTVCTDIERAEYPDVEITNATVKVDGNVVVGLSKAGKKAKSVSVAATVKNTGTYKVAAIEKNAFKGAAASSVTLNKNIKSIPASAFADCKNLTKLTLNAKLTSVKKDAFKGCKKAITVKGTAKKNNIKTLKKSGYKNFK